MNPLDDFHRAATARGLMFEDDCAIDDGQIHRCKVRTAKGHLRKNGWYVVSTGDGRPAGAFGRHDDGLGKEVWIADEDMKMSRKERLELTRRHRRQIAINRARRYRDHRMAAEEAAQLLKSSVKATTHPYLTRKGVGAHGVYLHDRDLVIPIRARGGRLMSVERITPNGSKWYLKNGKKSGGCHLIGVTPGINPAVVFIAEGYATAATIHEITGMPCAVAFDCENLLEVGWSLHWQHRKVPLVFCADDDWKTRNNPGVTKATEAAKAVRGSVAIPSFTGVRRNPGDTDFNDMAARLGADAVRDLLRQSVCKVLGVRAIRGTGRAQ